MATYMVHIKMQQEWVFEIETTAGPMDAQAQATAMMHDTFHVHQEMAIDTELKK